MSSVFGKDVVLVELLNNMLPRFNGFAD